MKKLVIIIIALAFLLSGCNSFQVESIFKTRDIVIDGNDEDWSDAKYYVKEHDVVFGVMNDNDFLYLCFYPTTSELTRQVLSQGLTLWINNDAKRKKNYGIHFPMGMQEFMKIQPEEKEEQKMSRQNWDESNFDSKQMKHMAKSIPREVEIIGPEKDKVQKINFNNLKGIEVGMNFEMDLFAYELKIPLEDNPAFTAYIGTEPNSTIAIGFEVPAPHKEDMKKNMDDMNSGMHGGMERGGSGGRPGGGQGRMSGNDESNRPSVNKLELWSIIQLVQK